MLRIKEQTVLNLLVIIYVKFGCYLCVLGTVRFDLYNLKTISNGRTTRKREISTFISIHKSTSTDYGFFRVYNRGSADHVIET